MSLMMRGGGGGGRWRRRGGDWEGEKAGREGRGEDVIIVSSMETMDRTTGHRHFGGRFERLWWIKRNKYWTRE
jgi:hypothetical protein